MTSLWITRTQPGADRSAALWRQAGFEPIVAPVFEAVAVDGADPLPDGAVPVFTSEHGVRFGGSLASGGKAYAVGGTTARAAEAAGFTPVINADGNVSALAQRIEKADTVFVHIGGRVVAGDLVGELRERGLRAERRIVYTTRPVAPDPDAVAAADWVAVYSPSAARTVAALLPGAWSGTVVALSAACASPFTEPKRRQSVVVASRPTEAALIAAAVRAGGA